MKKAKLNLIDKAIAFINPKGAVDRLVARQKLTKFEYDAVKYTRERKGPSALSGAEDYRSNYDRVELMKRARDLAENVGLVRSLLLKFAGHVAGSISYQARTQNPQINSDVEAYWAEWWDKCDISTRHTGSTLMQVAVMSMLRDGDFLFVLVRDGDGNLKIQGIEADRLGDPFKVYTSLELIGGIHIDRTTGAPTAYDIYNRSIGDFYTYQLTIPSSQAFHLFDPLRIDQYRGVSAFHTAINDATDIYELTSFEKMAAKTASSQSAIVKRNNNNAADLSTLTNDEDLAGNTIKLEAIESGKISYLEPGEDIVFPNGPSRPSGAFMEFHKVLMRNICLGLGIPYSFAVDPSQMSGPTARLEMQQAGRTFRRYQNLLNDKVLRPIKNIVLADAVARGLISGTEGTRTTKGIFNFGANVSIDLGRESASAISEFKTGLRTAADIYAERGQDFESAMRQRAIEAKLIKDLAEQYQIDPQTISDVVPPAKPEPQIPLPPITPEPPVSQEPPEDDDGEDEGGEEPEPDEPTDGGDAELEFDCGTGAGGFKEGNTCAGGGGGQEGWNPKSKDPAKWTDDELRKGIEEANKLKGDARMNHPAAKEHLRRMTERIEKNFPGASNRPMIKRSPFKDATPAGYGPSESSESSEEPRGGGQLTTEQQSYIRAIQEGKTILKGRVSQEKKAQIERSIKSAEDKLKKTGYEKSQDIDQPYKKMEAGEIKKKVLEELSKEELQMLIAGMMGGIELGKYDGIDFTPPEGAREAAKRALDVREKKPASQKGMTAVGIARARDLINGVKFSPDTVRRMKAFFDRHEVDKKGATWDDQGKGWQAWNGWGGDAGYAWARKVVRQMESRDKELSQKPQDIIEFLRGRDCGQSEGGTFGPGNECAVGYGRPAKEGGYTPIRPGGKWPSGYKVGEGQTGEDRKKSAEKSEEKKESAPKAKTQEQPIPKYKWNGKGKRPNPGVKIFNGQNNELDWNAYRSKQIEADKDAIWKAGDVGIKGQNLDFDKWADEVRNDRTAWQITNDYRGRYYTEINQKPDADVSKKLVSVMNKQKSFDQKGTMYRGMAFASDEDSRKFVSQFKNGGKLNRTLTSFTTDQSVADQFSGGGTSQVTMRLVKSKNLKRFSGLDRGSKGEKEYVLTYGARLRTVGLNVEKRKTFGGREFNEYIIDVEEY